MRGAAVDDVPDQATAAGLARVSGRLVAPSAATAEVDLPAVSVT
jgi:hypothetical protein